MFICRIVAKYDVIIRLQVRWLRLYQESGDTYIQSQIYDILPPLRAYYATKKKNHVQGTETLFRSRAIVESDPGLKNASKVQIKPWRQ
jgi:hypothetical protein